MQTSTQTSPGHFGRVCVYLMPLSYLYLYDVLDYYFCWCNRYFMFLQIRQYLMCPDYNGLLCVGTHTVSRLLTVAYCVC